MKIIQIPGITILAFLFLFSCSDPAPKTYPVVDEHAFQERVDSLLEAHGVHGTYTVREPKYRFEVTFPVSKKYVKKSTDTLIINNEETKTYSYAANMQHEEDVNLAYQLSYNVVGDLKTDKEIKKLFDEQRDYWLSVANAKLEMEKVIHLNGIPGRHICVTIDQTSTQVNYHIYYHRGAFYRLLVVTQGGNLFNKSISEFFNSFKIFKD